MIEILLLSILALAAVGYAGLWLRSRRRVRGRRALPVWQPVAVKELGPDIPAKERKRRDAEEEWLLNYALNFSAKERANVEMVWGEYVQRIAPRTQVERDRLRRSFLVQVARKKIEREMGQQ